MTTRIFWDPRDRQLLTIETLRLVDEQGLGLLKALKIAQPRVLPPAKVRNVTQLSAVKWLPEAVDTLRQQRAREQTLQAEQDALERQRQEALAAEEATRQAREAIPTGELVSMLQNRVESWASGMFKQVLLNVMRDPEVLDAAAVMLRGGMEAHALPGDSSWGEPVAAEALSPVRQTVQRLAKVLILGLLPGQENDIKREFKSFFNIRFMEADCSHRELRQNAQSAHFIFAMTGFINHPDEKQITSTAKDRYMRVDGGLTRLREALREAHATNRLPLRGFRQHGTTH